MQDIEKFLFKNNFKRTKHRDRYDHKTLPWTVWIDDQVHLIKREPTPHYEYTSEDSPQTRKAIMELMYIKHQEQEVA